MPAQRCSNCSINYPLNYEVCMACGQRTWLLRTESPDGNWEAASKRIMEKVEAEDSVYPHKAGAVCRIYAGKGELWATHAELLSCGYSNLEADSIIFVNDTFYELEGYAEAAESWWLREIVTEGAAESLEPAMFVAAEET